MAQSIPVDDFHRRVTRIVNRTPYYCRYIPYNLNSIPLGSSELISTDDNEVAARVIASAKRLSLLEKRDESPSFDCRHSYNSNLERYRLWSWARRKKVGRMGKIEAEEAATHFCPPSRVPCSTNVASGSDSMIQNINETRRDAHAA